MNSSPILRALEIARWAPSGDNSQPWRFKILDDFSVRIRIQRQLDNPYEYKDGEPVLISTGALLESLRIAASAEGYTLDWRYEGYTEPHFTILATLVPSQISADPLLSSIPIRSVNRKPMKMKALNIADKDLLTASLGGKYRILWLERDHEKWGFTWLAALSTDLRLRMRESYTVLARALEWDHATSETKLPVDSLPLSRFTRMMMRWLFVSWSRIDFMNRFMGGTIAPIIETDFVPNMRCGAHIIFETPKAQNTPEEAISFGMALQRFWLTATSLSLSMQPIYSPLIFGYYGNHELTFTDSPTIRRKAIILGRKMREFFIPYGFDPDRLIFAGRIGYPIPTKKPSRSFRLPLEKLIDA